MSETPSAAPGAGARVSDCVVLAKVPDGPLAPEHFALQTEEVPDPGPGEVLMRVQAITIGAGQRAGLQGSASYAGAPEVGVVMRGTGSGVVEASNADGINVGDTVVGWTGWRRHAVMAAGDLRVADGSLAPAVHLGLLGTNGLTAYFGLLEVGAAEGGRNRGGVCGGQVRWVTPSGRSRRRSGAVWSVWPVPTRSARC